MRLSPLLVVVLSVGISAFALAGDDSDKPEPEKKAETPAKSDAKALPLAAGTPVEGSVSTSTEEDNVKTYRFTVPDDAIMARLDLTGRADVNLYVARKPMEDHDAKADDGGPVAKSAELTATEKIVLYRDGRLEPGVWYADVAYERKRPPVRPDGTEIDRVAFHLALTVVRARVDGKLEAGKTVVGTIDPSDGGFRTYTVNVPEGTSVLRLDLFGAPADLNLRARREKPMLTEDEADKTATSLLGTEVLVLKEDDLKPGLWYVDVTDPHALEFAVPFKLRATFKADPAADLTTLPKLPAASTALDRALLATVELVDEEGGGSGVLISDKGYVLTNYHVVQDKVESHGMIGEPIVVGLTVDPRDPPHELFRARVVTASADLDLALLKCVTGLYGQPIPADFRFPAAALGTPDRLGMGDPVIIIGYPTAGGTGSRASATFTRGVVAGFERRGATVHMKTDAMINSGNSGGAALDDKLQVIGFPTEVVGDEAGKNGQIGYIRPLWLVPADWWEKAGVTPPKQKP